MSGSIWVATSAPDASRSNIPDTTDGLEQGQTSPSDNGSMETMSASTTRKRLSKITRGTKAKTKKLFKLDGAVGDQQSENVEKSPPNVIKNDNALHSSQSPKRKRFRPGKTAERTLGAIQNISNAVAHPVKAAKSTATRTTAGQLSKAERPFLSQEADIEFLRAHDNLERAESSRSSSKQDVFDEDQESLIGSHRDKIREMEEHRESLRVAWTTSRHVRRVRAIRKRHFNFPGDECSMERNARGDFVRYDWLTWFGHYLVYLTQDFSAHYIDDLEELPFDVDSLKHYVERFLVASAPWQRWAMKVRAVYRWENPQITGKWLALYVCLWYTHHIMGFLYFYIIYIVLMNRYYPTTIESLRESQRRAVDSSASAHMFSELIDKHGRENWLESVKDSLGPYIQLQLGDMANMLEVFSNFYHWKSPNKTIASLYFFASCLLVSVLADMEFCMQIVGFIVGGAFFFCWPVASAYLGTICLVAMFQGSINSLKNAILILEVMNQHYPKYRYLVSPFKWVLWDIPTNAEWSFAYLRRQAQITRERIVEKKVENDDFQEPATDEYKGRLTKLPKIVVEGSGSRYEENNADDDQGWYSACSTNDVLETSDIRSFRCQSHKAIGRLCVHAEGIRFVRTLPSKVLWRRKYLELAEMRKVEGSTISKLTSLSPNQLEIDCVDGSKLHLEGVKERDEAFNIIVAHSGMQWQCLQILSSTTPETAHQ